LWKEGKNYPKARERRGRSKQIIHLLRTPIKRVAGEREREIERETQRKRDRDRERE
jgi:hypothetical protein